MTRHFWIFVFLLLQTNLTQAFEYKLKPILIAENTWVIPGPNEEFTRENGGHEINTAFINTEEGVVVIDSGPSRLFGMALHAKIKELTNQEITQIYLTNHLPDRFLGIQAFPLNLVAALPTTREQIRKVGSSLLDNMYRLVGDAMRGTELRMPEIEVVLKERNFGSHRLKFWSLKGHTPGDLVILDQKTGVLFTGGVVFNGRAPTTPFADIRDWHQELELIEKIDFKLLVPSHGEVSTDSSAISDTREYLNWLDQTFQRSAAQGLHMMEVMTIRKPESMKEKWELFEEEYPRTVVHLYPDYERDQLRLIGTPE